ncbi:MAG: hypothetical protein A2Z49_01280 [Chloroflexi bacterium RBG_19FT_COMBO_56_12]|nr:MAG: hypothetical protein A2Z49_01280 [Chloroflexi bacterium RBG_19FT_COMBO_56_12]
MAGAGWLSANVRNHPIGSSQQLFQGITYTRETRNSPRLMIIHVITVDLRAESLGFLVTPGDPNMELPLKARTTSQFLADFSVQVAVNGDGFTPWRSNSVLDYYPHPGDPVKPAGLAASLGKVYSSGASGLPTLYISQNNRASINNPPGKIYNAISGTAMLVRNGRVVNGLDGGPEPRTALALDRRNRKMLVVVVDGRQPDYSQGATLAELAQIILEYQGYNAINLDGGGSTALVFENRDGSPQLLNAPIDNQLPGRERPVGNHLGIFARRTEE